MAGQPFKVGRFAHTLRVRLMREHLGIDVDALCEESVMAHQSKPEYQQPLEPEPDLEQDGNEGGVFYLKKSEQKIPIGVCALKVNQSKCSWKVSRYVSSYICDLPASMASEEPISAETGKIFLHEDNETPVLRDRTLGEEDINEKRRRILSLASSVVRTLEEKAIIEKQSPKDETDEATLKDQSIMEEWESVSVQSGHSGLANGGPHEPSTAMDSGAPAKHKSLSLKSDVDSEDATSSARETLRTNLGSRSGRKPWTVPTVKPKVGLQDFEDPISDAFWKNIWVASAVHNVSASSWTSILSNSMLC